MVIVKCFYWLLILSIATFSHGRPSAEDYNAIEKEISSGDGDLPPLIIRFNDDVEKRCGYASCPVPKPDKLNVHIVPHTHDDVGWLKNVDEYYYGSRTKIQKAGVQYIIDSVIQSLLNDPKKKFIYVESAFFFKWWREQTEELQNQVKMLVNQGRLEFTGGAWSMNDEATTHYQSVVDQFAWGLKRLNDTFGECGRPRIGWQIDPFGHAREMASMFAQMGYDGLFFGRLDWEDKDHRLETKTPEMIWRASPNLGQSSDLFTGALYNQYQPPSGFCFDILCADEPIIDNKHSPDYNVKERVDEYLAFVSKQRKYFRTNNIILTMGGDFTYMDANVYFKNLDKMIRYANERQSNGSEYNLFYSTPACYLKALHDANITWPTKDDDFFPYASDPHAYWTGYFTSRPTLKRFERVGNHFLQISKQLASLAPNTEKMFEPHLTFLRETMGVMQHHDAVTGTEKEQVAFDYARRLDIAIRACEANSRAILNNFVTGDANPDVDGHDQKVEYKFEFKNCMDLNISHCEVSEKNDKFVVTLYNPLAHSTFEYVRIPVKDQHYEVVDYKGTPVPFQIVPVPKSISHIEYRETNSSVELVFLANELPPIGYKSFYVSRTQNAEESTSEPEVTLVNDDPAVEAGPIVIGNKYINLTFGADGLLSSVSSNGATRKIKQEFLYYQGATGNNMEFKNRSSGAYIFRPNGTEHLISAKATIEVIRGDVVDEVHQVFNEWVSQVVRVYKDDNFAEFDWLVGPIPVGDDIGKEIVTRFSSDIKSNKVFYTDSNGREMIKRVRNHRDTWTPHIEEPIAGNYYPLTTKISLEDDEARMSVLVDRAQGGSSMQDGALEVMVHRRLLHDDAFGVDEALNEYAFGSGLIARGTHYLVVGKKGLSPSTEAQERLIQLKKTLPCWVFFSNATAYPFAQWQTNYTHIYSGLSLSLPQNIHLMTLEPWDVDKLLIRFEHIMEKDEDEELSKPTTFNLGDVFRNLAIIDIRETTLDGSQWLSDKRRLKFREDPEGTVYEVVEDFENIKDDYAERVKEAESKDDRKKRSKTKRSAQFDEDPLLSSRHKEFDGRRYRRDVGRPADIKLTNPARQRAMEDTSSVDSADKLEITVGPMQMRTFVLTLEQKI